MGIRRTLGISISLAGLLASTAAVGYAFAAHKNVDVDVEGSTYQIGTYAATVQDLLDKQGIEYSAGDLVVPSPDSTLTDGAEIVVRYSKTIPVTDGATDSTFVTTALDTDEALSDLAARGGGLSILVGRSTDREALTMDLKVDQGQQVIVHADGKDTAVSAPSERLGDVLSVAGITTANNDTVTLTRGEDGSPTIVVTRKWTERRTATSDIPFAEERRDDASLYKGTEKVVHEGQVGTLEVVTDVDLVDGVEVATREVSRTTTLEPVTKVIAVGTKVKPKVVAPATTTTSSSGGEVATGGSGGGLNWAALASCESGGNPGAVSRSGKYYGLYQFSVATWQSVGGSGLPSDASADEQTQRAIALYNRSGAGQWPTCGPRLFS